MKYLQFSILFLFVVLFSLSTPVYSAYPPSQESAVVSAVKKAKPSVVKIKTTSKDGRTGGGSGIVLTKDGYILTNEHVVRNASTIQVILVNGKTFSAVICGTSASKDLAVIKVKASNLPVPKFGDSSKLELGQTAIAIGNPLQFQWTVTVGCISALNRDIQRKDLTYRNMIQTDTAINSGSSGGALINLSGEVIGVNTVVYRAKNAQGLSFAIPINTVREVANNIMNGSYSKGNVKLGITARTVSRWESQVHDVPPGTLIIQISENSSLKGSDIKKGDIIIKINDTKILDTETLKEELSLHKPGDVVSITVFRPSASWKSTESGTTFTTKITLIEDK